MIKMTIVTDANGGLVAAIQGHALTEKRGDVEVGVSFPKGHQLHQVEVDDDLARITDHAEVQKRLYKYLHRP